ncbi:alpha-amylase family glycosyl hydrolase [Rhodohalobacter sp.]|uniref:alpha-amylase family glycosyl hydrolase n=1 Tax=Rhodohalobacter sp. TaxID=1974210 RepID=UPI002ACE5D69|nr:alpha-amylase family glycosyl hydrolase [Rhodohalobacter sp.]MDZ7755936.1 alpha-amylase family glycosyl hydrolase [Rhodohalobacter sp.]
MTSRLFKTIFLLLILVLSAQTVAGQVITTEPAFPTEDEPLTIIFDAKEDQGGELEGYTGSLYAHTGLIVSEANQGSSEWEYVIGTWGNNSVQPQLTSLGNDRWELEINDIRDFYDVPESEDKIYQIAIVFRSSDGSRQSRPDLFIDLSDEELQVRFTSPDVSALNPYFTEVGQTVNLQIEAASAQPIASLTLFEGETELTSTTESSLQYDYTVTNTGRTDFYTEVEDDQGNVVSDSLYIVVNPPVNVQARPNGIEDGIHYHEDPTTVTFSFYAPDKDFAYLIGDMTDWEVSEEHFMNLDNTDPTGNRFWITVNDLTPGDQYRFQYFIDGEIRVADLYSELILDSNNDQYIEDSIYPNMPQYPYGFTEHAVTVIEPGAEEYEWQIPDFERPEKEELVVYELLLRDFLEESSYEVLTDTLDYLDNLGVNAIELMPIQEFSGNISWGYNPVFHGALDKAYGSKDSFKRFVDEAHSRGIAVLLDVVYNHAEGNSPLIRIYGSDRNTNPLIGPGHAYNVFNHLNHDHPYIQYWLDRMNRYWLEEYNIDGYRFDLSKGFASNVDNRSNLDGYNSDRIANLKRMADEMWSVDPDSYVILEHLGASSEEAELSDYGMMLWGKHNGEYSEASMGYSDNSDFSGVYYGNRGWSNPNLIGYMESHDEQWIMFRNLNFGNDLNENHDITELDVALNRQKLTGAFFLTIPGPKMIWQFGELGYGGGPGECLKPGDGSDGSCLSADVGRTDPKPIRWDYYSEENRLRLYKTWSELLRLRHSSPVFSSAETEFEASLGSGIKWIRLQHEDMDAVIVGNFSVLFRDATVDFTQQGEWNEFVTGNTLDVGNVRQTFNLAPGEVRIYTSEFVEPAEENVFFQVGESNFGQLIRELSIESNYPNPFNPSTQIEYEVPEAGAVVLDVYDVLGRRVATIVNNSEHPRGSFTVDFDASELSSGVYIARLKQGGQVVTEKMTLIK